MLVALAEVFPLVLGVLVLIVWRVRANPDADDGSDDDGPRDPPRVPPRVPHRPSGRTGRPPHDSRSSRSPGPPVPARGRL